MTESEIFFVTKNTSWAQVILLSATSLESLKVHIALSFCIFILTAPSLDLHMICIQYVYFLFFGWVNGLSHTIKESICFRLKIVSLIVVTDDVIG